MLCSLSFQTVATVTLSKLTIYPCSWTCYICSKICLAPSPFFNELAWKPEVESKYSHPSRAFIKAWGRKDSSEFNLGTFPHTVQRGLNSKNSSLPFANHRERRQEAQQQQLQTNVAEPENKKINLKEEKQGRKLHVGWKMENKRLWESQDAFSRLKQLCPARSNWGLMTWTLRINTTLTFSRLFFDTFV